MSETKSTGITDLYEYRSKVNSFRAHAIISTLFCCPGLHRLARRDLFGLVQFTFSCFTAVSIILLFGTINGLFAATITPLYSLLTAGSTATVVLLIILLPCIICCLPCVCIACCCPFFYPVMLLCGFPGMIMGVQDAMNSEEYVCKRLVKDGNIDFELINLFYNANIAQKIEKSKAQEKAPDHPAAPSEPVRSEDDNQAFSFGRTPNPTNP